MQTSKRTCCSFLNEPKWMSCWPAEKPLKHDTSKEFEACFDRQGAQLTANQAIFDSPRVWRRDLFSSLGHALDSLYFANENQRKSSYWGRYDNLRVSGESSSCGQWKESPAKGNRVVKKECPYNRQQEFNHGVDVWGTHGLLNGPVGTRQLLHAESMRYGWDYQSRDSRTAKKGYR